MENGEASADIQAIAAEAFALLGDGRQIAPFSSRYPHFGMDEAYRVTAELRRLREARGERVIGRKIGFTNRTIWAEYEVYAPIWGYVYDRTVRALDEVDAGFALAGLAEPRIEPEIMFGLSTAPTAGMDERALLGCIAWVAHGFEIVQSIFPAWKFAAADTVAAFGLHGALFVGPRVALNGDLDHWARRLEAFEIDLLSSDEFVEHGLAANVLDGPLFALRHLVQLLASDSINPPLAAGEIVTTGTLTRAYPVSAGQTWSTELQGIPLAGARINFI